MDITKLAYELRLPYIRENHKMLLDEANHTKMGYQEFLQTLLEHEFIQRKENGIKNRLRNARFPTKKYLEDFDPSKYGTEIRAKFKELNTLDFITAKENIILIGSPGSGKTHYATALGIKACMEAMNVLFVSVPNLIIELKEAMSLNQLNTYKRKFEKYDLVILDELGYVSFDKEGCEILFNLLSNRNDKGSIIITTNLSFDRWEEIFKDAMLTGAIVDRLAHKAHIMDISRETSHRYEETIAWLSNKS
ncbi:MAG: IS21-like element helper ATPase IstB [Bacillota bacterium]|nr:IS21-like element helper ATPase IstB [Bacillota bacterium]